LTFAMLKDLLFPPHHTNLRHIGMKTSNVDSFQTIWRGLNLCLVVWGFVSIDETWILVLWVDSIILMGKFLWFATLFMMFWTAIFLFSLICCFHHHCFVQAWRSCAL
jgi:hypothetical protein